MLRGVDSGAMIEVIAFVVAVAMLLIIQRYFYRKAFLRAWNDIWQPLMYNINSMSPDIIDKMIAIVRISADKDTREKIGELIVEIRHTKEDSKNFYIKISSLMQKVDALNMGSDLNGTYQKLKSVIDKSCTLIRECKNTEPKDYDRLKDLYVRSLRLTRDLESAVEELSCLYKSLGLKSKDDDFGETDIYLAEILDTSETRD